MPTPEMAYGAVGDDHEPVYASLRDPLTQTGSAGAEEASASDEKDRQFRKQLGMMIVTGVCSTVLAKTVLQLRLAGPYYVDNGAYPVSTRSLSRSCTVTVCTATVRSLQTCADMPNASQLLSTHRPRPSRQRLLRYEHISVQLVHSRVDLVAYII